MKRKSYCLAVVCLLLVLAVIFELTGCSMMGVDAANLMEDIKPNTVTVPEDLDSHSGEVTDFAVRLLKTCDGSGKNTLLSPLSLLYALSMTANGADDETLSQMEDVLGMTVDEANLFFYCYMNSLPDGDEGTLRLANSIWFDDGRFEADKNFLQTNADYYGADLFKAPFNDQICGKINEWVKQKTDGMIPEIFDEIPGDAVMCLVNALSFDAEWNSIYADDQVRDGQFTREDGVAENVELMYGKETNYLEDGGATGFIKHYEGERFAFAALLPKEGVTLSEYIASLDGETLSKLLSSPEQKTVYTAIPKFEAEYSAEMIETLKDMGMSRPFDSGLAQFGRVGSSTDGNLYIGRVIHKTYISVGSMGTRAGAASGEILLCESEPVIPEDEKVYLDRPFLYMLIDCEKNIPLFIGTMEDIG